MTILENAAYLLDGNPSMTNTRLLKESIWDNSYDRDAPKWILDHWDVVFPETDKPEDPNEAKRMAKEKVAQINVIFNHPVDYTLGCPNDRDRDADGNEIGPRVYEMKIIRMFCLGLVRILYGELHYETEFVNPRKIEDLKKCILTALVADRKAQMASRGGQVTYPWSTDLNGKTFNQLKTELLPHYQEAKETLAEWDRSWHERNHNSHRVSADAPAEEIEAADDGTIDDGLPQPDMSDAVRLGDYNVKWIQNHKQSSCWNKYTNKVSSNAGCNWCITIPSAPSHWDHYMERHHYPTVYFLWKDNFKELKRQDYNVEPFYSQQPYNDWGKSLMCLMVKSEGHEWKFAQLTSRYNHFKGDGYGGFQSDSGGWGDYFARNAEDAAHIIGCTVAELKQACPVRERPDNYQDTGRDYSQDQSVFGLTSDDPYISDEAAHSREAFDQVLVNTPYSIVRLVNKYNADCTHLPSGDNIAIVCPDGTGNARRIFINGFPMNNEWYRSVELIGSRSANDLKDVLFRVRYRDKKCNIIDANNFKYLPRNVDKISAYNDDNKVEVMSNHKINIFDIKKRKFMYTRSLDANTVAIRTSDGYYTDNHDDTSDDHYKIHAPNGEICFDKQIRDFRWPTSRSIFVYETSSGTYVQDLKTNETIFSHTGDFGYMNIASYTGTPIIILQIDPTRMRDNCGAIIYNQITHKVVAKFEKAYALTNTSSNPYDNVRDRAAIILHRDSNDEDGIYKLSFISLLTGKIINTVEIPSAHSMPTIGTSGTITVKTQPAARRKVIYQFDNKGNELHRYNTGDGFCVTDIGYNANEMFFYDSNNNIQFIRNGEVLYSLEHATDLNIKSIQLDHKWYYFIKNNSRSSNLWYSVNDNGEFGMAVQSASCIETISHIGNKIVLVPDGHDKSTLVDLTTMRPLIRNKVLACLSPFDENGIAKIKLDRIGTRFINTEGDIAASAEALTEAARRKSKKRTPVMTERKKSPGNLDFAAFLMD